MTPSHGKQRRGPPTPDCLVVSQSCYRQQQIDSELGSPSGLPRLPPPCQELLDLDWETDETPRDLKPASVGAWFWSYIRPVTKDNPAGGLMRYWCGVNRKPIVKSVATEVRDAYLLVRTLSADFGWYDAPTVPAWADGPVTPQRGLPEMEIIWRYLASKIDGKKWRITTIANEKPHPEYRPLPRSFQEFEKHWQGLVKAWDANRISYIRGDDTDYKRAVEIAEQRIGELFQNSFAPLADALVDAIDPGFGDEIPHLEHPPEPVGGDDGDYPKWLTGSSNTVEAGKRMLYWGARAHDPEKRDAGIQISNRYRRWATKHLIYCPKATKANEVEAVARGINQWLNWIPKFLATIEIAIDVEAKANRTAKKRGRRRANESTELAERQIYEDWNRAYESGVSKFDFADERGMKVKDLKLLLDRVAARIRRADK